MIENQANLQSLPIKRRQAQNKAVRSDGNSLRVISADDARALRGDRGLIYVYL